MERLMDGWRDRGREGCREGWSIQCTVNVLLLAVYSIWLFWWKAASAISSTSPNAMHVYILIMVTLSTYIKIFVLCK